MSIITVSDDLDQLVEQATRESGQTKTDFVREAIEARLEDLHDLAIARERLANPGKRYSLAEMKEDLGLDD